MGGSLLRVNLYSIRNSTWIINPILRFLVAILFLNDVTAQSFEVVYSDELVADLLGANFAAKEIVPFSNQNKFALACARNDWTSPNVIIVFIDEDGGVENHINLSTPLLHAEKLGVVVRNNTLTYYSYKWEEVSSCIVVPNNPMLPPYTAIPGFYSLFYNTSVDLNTGQVVGDTLSNFGNFEQCDIPSLLSYDLLWTDGHYDYVAFSGEEEFIKVVNDSIVDTLSLLDPRPFSIGAEYENGELVGYFPSAGECDEDVNCMYEVYDVLIEEELLLYNKMVTTGLEIIDRKIAVANYFGEIVEEYDHPYQYLNLNIDDGQIDFASNREHSISRLGVNYVYFNPNVSIGGIEQDELSYLAILDEEFKIVKQLEVGHLFSTAVSNEILIVDNGDWLILDASDKLVLFDKNLNYVGSYHVNQAEGLKDFIDVTFDDQEAFYFCGSILSGPNQPSTFPFVKKIELNQFVITDDIPTVLSSMIDEECFKVIPNPSAGRILIENIRQDVEVKLLSLNGTVLKKEVCAANSIQWDLRGLPSGLYFIQHGAMTRKFLKK